MTGQDQAAGDASAGGGGAAEPEAPPPPPSSAPTDRPGPGGLALEPDDIWSQRVRQFRFGLLSALALGAPCASLLGRPEDDHLLPVLLLTSASLATAAFLQNRGHAIWPWVVLAAVAAGVGLGGALADRPEWAFALGLLVLALLSWRRRPLRRGGLDAAHPETLAVWGALGPATAMVLLTSLARDLPPGVLVSASFTSALAAVLGLQALRRVGLDRPARARGMAVWAVLVAIGLLGGDAGLRSLMGWLAAALPIAVDDLRDPVARPFGPLLESVLGRPELLLVASFAATIALGSLLLCLPLAAEGDPVAAIDAFFTAVSATCVTGLVVVDTPTVFSTFGELVILALIQVGGLGIMTFSTAALFVLKRRPSVRHERALAGVFASWGRFDVGLAIRHIIVVTLAIEAAGALALAARFAVSHGDDLATALWRGVFTSISAFCNAGFALQTDSLVAYQGDPVVMLTVGGLIALGSLGPFAMVILFVDVLRPPKPPGPGASVDARSSGVTDELGSARAAQPKRSQIVAAQLMAAMALGLTLLGAVLFAAFEWGGVLGPLTFGDRLSNALFQSITLRTAGFNSIDFLDLATPTQVFMIVWMFIGGSPGSTAGGIKTTTFAVIVMSLASALSGRPEAVHRGWRISHDTFYRSTAIFFLGLASVVSLWGALLLTQAVEPLAALFETVSALGTVGLTVGVTTQLDEVGKLLVAGGMFVGRVGAVTVLFLFASEAPPTRRRFPETSLPVG